MHTCTIGNIKYTVRSSDLYSSTSYLLCFRPSYYCTHLSTLNNPHILSALSTSCLEAGVEEVRVWKWQKWCFLACFEDQIHLEIWVGEEWALQSQGSYEQGREKWRSWISPATQSTKQKKP